MANWYWRTSDLVIPTPSGGDDVPDSGRFRFIGPFTPIAGGPAQNPKIGALLIATPPFGRPTLIDRVNVTGRVLLYNGHLQRVTTWEADAAAVLSLGWFALQPDLLIVHRSLTALPPAAVNQAVVQGTPMEAMNIERWIGGETNVISRDFRGRYFEPVGTDRDAVYFPAAKGGLIDFRFSQPYRLETGESLIVFNPWTIADTDAAVAYSPKKLGGTYRITFHGVDV